MEVREEGMEAQEETIEISSFGFFGMYRVKPNQQKQSHPP